MLFVIILSILLSVHENSAQDKVKAYSISIENHTSCEEFVANYTFDPQSVIDVDWKIFYFWSHTIEESYNIRFSVPSEMLIDRFRVELDSEMKPPVNWSNAVLFMESSIDFSALYIKTNVSGIFNIVPSLAFEYNHAPQLVVGLKVVEPGYLGILNCKHRLCYALAPVDKMPHHDFLEQEAKKLGFRSNFGRTHIATIPSPPPLDPDHLILDDDDEIKHLELIHNEDMQLF